MTRITGEEDSLDGTLPEDYLDGQTGSMIGSTGRGWKGTRGDGSM